MGGACAQVLPGGRLLAAADEAGSVSVSDLRMMGTNRKALLWQVRCTFLPILQASFQDIFQDGVVIWLLFKVSGTTSRSQSDA